MAQKDSWTPHVEETKVKTVVSDKEEKKRLIERFKTEAKMAEGGRPLNIALIGPPGVGKSSLINTISSLKETKYGEYARSGQFGMSGEQNTYFTQSYKPDDWYTEDNSALFERLPTFIDIAGFQDEDSDIIEEILRIVFYGCLRDGESLKEAEELGKRDDGIKCLVQKYGKREGGLKVDRIIFVGSATEPVPKNLIKCVIRAAQPKGNIKGKRDVPILGIFTMVDQMDSDFSEKEKSFIECLGLKGADHRYTSLTNYCQDVDKEKRRMETYLPKLDIPALKFLIQVCDPALKVHFDERYIDTRSFKEKSESTTAKFSTMSFLATHAIRGILIAIFTFFILSKSTAIINDMTSVCNTFEAKIASGQIIDRWITKGLNPLCQKVGQFPEMSPSIPTCIAIFIAVTTFLDFVIPKVVQKLHEYIF